MSELSLNCLLLILLMKPGSRMLEAVFNLDLITLNGNWLREVFKDCRLFSPQCHATLAVDQALSILNTRLELDGLKASLPSKGSRYRRAV